MYGHPQATLKFDDRVLAHLRVVIVAKLRRSEPFTLQFGTESRTTAGSTVVWFHPSIPLQFTFSGGREVRLNRAWIDEMMLGASSNGGLVLGSEPELTALPATTVAE
ncbi:ATP-dependent DNA ligase [Subtercola vilae]|uniref:ATP-dependent DNA ligase n=2 Tax=Microbacteriaceae TaxID=85023 RepID=A0A4T2CCM7_9MICO|nr:ATP-dependent DNA ligase [Subtercola sp. RTI3]TIH41011.1 ATP-dependent DNA ligase [Subtercola vilae]